MRGKRKRRGEDLESLLLGIAHEIRNPLNALNINSQLLSEYADMLPEWFPKKGEMKDIIASDLEVLRRLNDLVSEFLRLTRPPRPEFVVSDLNGIVEELLRFVEVEFRGRGIKIRFLPGKGPMMVLVDTKMVKQALLNVLLNGAEALDKEDKVLTLSTSREGEGFSLSVKDNGCGIAREERKKIFTLFYTTKGEGSGIGLPMVKKIMGAHHGTVRLRGRKGKGTTFVLHFPSAERFREIFRGKGGVRDLPEVVR